MNKPAHPVVADPWPSPAYETDGYGWAMAQAQLIRERRWDAVDWDNVAEEIQSVGKSEARAVESALRIVLLHLLKWEHQRTHRSRSWRNSIAAYLKRFDRELADNPGLKSRLDGIKADAYDDARTEAANETGFAIELFPVEPPSWDEIRAPLED